MLSHDSHIVGVKTVNKLDRKYEYKSTERIDEVP
jgi:hypothetical protein